MNIKESAENLGLEEEEYLELIELFIETGITDLANLQSAVEKERIQEVVYAAHSLKGAAANLGLTSIAEIAKQIEEMAHEDRLEGAMEAIRSIKMELDAVTDFSRRVK
jgi:HPt (histidine-containing phosphotransfer) domain-containing protein